MVKESNHISLGQMFLEAHGIGGADAVYSSSFLTADHKNPYPYPGGDAYLSRLGVRVAGSGDTVLCATMIPGELEYLRKLGIAHGVNVVEVTPQIRDSERPGYPFSDPVGLLDGQVEFAGNGRPSYMVTVFSNQELSRQAKGFGLEALVQPDSTITNNKASFREASRRYGFRVLPGVVMRGHEDLYEAAHLFGNTEHGVWLKFPTGSGGDLVKHIETVDERGLLVAVDDMRVSIWKALQKGTFRVSGDEFWPTDRLTPEGMPLVVESDARNHGEVVLNGSNYFTTRRDGVQTNGYFQQITTEAGEYVGSRPFHPDSEMLQELNDNTRRVGAYNLVDNRYRGIQGLDFFLIKGRSGKTTIYNTELNSRPPISAFADLFAKKLGVESWININLYTQTDIRTIDDFIATVGTRLAYGERDLDGRIVAGVFPQAFRSMPSRTVERGSEFLASPNLKVLIGARSAEECDGIKMQLAEDGIQFSPPK